MLGVAYDRLGKLNKAVEFIEQGLSLSRQANDFGWESTLLSNLAGSYASMGRYEEAVDLYEKALEINLDKLSKKENSTVLIGLALAKADLGKTSEAIELYNKALNSSRKDNENITTEAYCMENLGDAFLDLGELDQASSCYLQAIRIAEEIHFIETQNYARWGLSQVCLLRNDLDTAYNTIIDAQKYDVPLNNHNISTLEGITALRQGRLQIAANAFHRAIDQADSIISYTPEYFDALDAKGFSLCGLAVLEDKINIDYAKDTFLRARKITCAEGIIKRNLRIFDELVKTDAENVLLGIRHVVEGKV